MDHRLCAVQLQQWMHVAGLNTWTDAIGNVHGRLQSANLTAPTLVLGSHYDTVVDAGRFDGALGIIAAICAVKAFTMKHLMEPDWKLGACT
jgi:allantoate deiminase